MAFLVHHLRVLVSAGASELVRVAASVKARDRASVLVKAAATVVVRSASAVVLHHQPFFHVSSRNTRRKRVKHGIKARSFLKQSSRETAQWIFCASFAASDSVWTKTPSKHSSNGGSNRVCGTASRLMWR